MRDMRDIKEKLEIVEVKMIRGVRVGRAVGASTTSGCTQSSKDTPGTGRYRMARREFTPSPLLP